MSAPSVTRRSAPVELGYTAVTTPHTGIGNADTDVNGMTVTFTAGSRIVLLHAYIPYTQQNTTARIEIFKLTDSANTEVARADATVTAGSWGGPWNLWARLSGLTPGTPYTYKVRARSFGGDTLDVNCGATFPAFITAFER